MIGTIIDIALIVIIIACAFRGYRNGMVRGLCGFLAIVLSLVIANAAASAFSDEFTDALHPFVGGIVDGQVQKILSPDEEEDISLDYDTTTTRGVVMNTLTGLGFVESVAEKIADGIEKETREIGYALSDIISNKLSSALANIAVFAVVFLLLSIVFAIVGNVLNLVFSLPGLRLVDQIIGTGLGLLKGVVIVMFLALVFRYLGLVGADIAGETRVLEYFVRNNVVANLMGV